MKISFPVISASALSLFLGACSTPSAESLAQNDPWEKTNRDIFDFDVKMDHVVARPIAKGYRAVVPEFARDGVHNFLTNLNSPVILANDVLQGDGPKAGDTLGRIVVNTTVGIGGLIDVASKIGIPYHDNDAGITLGKGGVFEGSYLVLPFIGPLPPRDLVGSGVDGAFDPLSYAHFSGHHVLQLSRSAVRILDTVDQRRDDFENIERTSVDFYATTRNLYRQNRNAKIRGGEEDNNAFVNLPDL